MARTFLCCAMGDVHCAVDGAMACPIRANVRGDSPLSGDESVKDEDARRSAARRRMQAWRSRRWAFEMAR